MRDMLLVGGFAMPYGTVVGVGGAIFAGLMLHFGIEKTAIGLILSLVQLTGLLQLVTFRLTDLAHPRALILGVGTLEILFTISVITVPFWVPPDFMFAAVVLLVGLGWAASNVHVPTFNSWFASIIPSEMRGRFISRRTFVQYVVGIVASLLAGKFIDTVPGLPGFAGLYFVALVFGLMTYWVLLRTPLPQLSTQARKTEETESHLVRILTPLRHKEYRTFVIFNMVWTLVAAMPGPYYNIFMIEALHLSYSTIALFTSAQMIIMGLGFRFWGVVVDRFGGKPMMQLLFIPAAAMPALWAFATPTAYYTVPVAMLFGGLMWSGLSISNSIMLYTIIPQHGQKSSYFAVWSVSLGLVNSLAPALGSGVMKVLSGLHVEAFGLTFDNYHALFILTSVANVAPALLLVTLPELGSQRPGYVISQLTRGNPFSLAYNFFLLGRSDTAARRADVLRSLGRSRSPLAVKRLVAALDDPVPEVRQSAALALGDSNQAEAVEALLAHLTDTESDIRAEAARALGSLQEQSAVPALVNALNGDDPELQIAAAEALGKIDDPAARDALVARLRGPFDRALIPTIIESLSYPINDGPLGDLRMIRPAITMLPRFRSRVIKTQLLNAVARCLGADDTLLTLIVQDPYERDSQLQNLVDKTRKALLQLRWPEERELLVATTFERMALARTENRIPLFIEMAPKLAEMIRERFTASRPGDPPQMVEEGCAALIALEANRQLETMDERGVIFTVLVLHRVGTQALNEQDLHTARE